MTQDRKLITKLPAAWPSRGMIRSDFGDYIVLAHPDRPVMLSKDGKTWEEANLFNPLHNQAVAGFERKRWAN